MPQLDSFAAATISDSLPNDLASALQDAPLADLDGGPQVTALAEQLIGTDPADWEGVTDAGRELATSGLWLAAGDLDRSHTISQNLGSAEGSFWHGIMHRREGDFGNSKYWFRRVGEHPVFAQIAEQSSGDYPDPFEFVDRCSRARRRDQDEYQRCQQAQWREWQALMAYCLTL